MNKRAILFFIVLMVGFSWSYAADKPLRGVIVVIDSGHGDSGLNLPADPGCYAETDFGTAWECVFTWDTAMRLKSLLETKGAKVFLTLKDPYKDYLPRNWGPQKFPAVKNGGDKKQELFQYKQLVDFPNPNSNCQALESRAATANRIYRQYSRDYDVYFISLHFDSTSSNLMGMSFYYSQGTEFVDYLLAQLKKEKRARVNFDTKQEYSVANCYGYYILKYSQNPDSYLIELGNINSQNDKGKNPDLWRMRNPANRQTYAGLIVRALINYIKNKK